jgi:F0F1-type ATP synthase membrane subunit c/vacuolar-type H+-ATPase subunit K
VARASASASFSATTSPRPSAIRRPPRASFGNLIFGFAITEALGIFSLLIALLLLFAL